MWRLSCWAGRGRALASHAGVRPANSSHHSRKRKGTAACGIRSGPLRTAKRLGTVGDGDNSAGRERTIASRDRRDCVADHTCDEVRSSLRLVGQTPFSDGRHRSANPSFITCHLSGPIYAFLGLGVDK